MQCVCVCVCVCVCRPTFPLAVEMVGQDVKLYSSLSFYALFVLAPAVAMLPDFIWTVYVCVCVCQCVCVCV